jgi:hypothetical protein
LWTNNWKYKKNENNNNPEEKSKRRWIVVEEFVRTFGNNYSSHLVIVVAFGFQNCK